MMMEMVYVNTCPSRRTHVPHTILWKRFFFQLFFSVFFSENRLIFFSNVREQADFLFRFFLLNIIYNIDFSFRCFLIILNQILPQKIDFCFRFSDQIKYVILFYHHSIYSNNIFFSSSRQLFFQFSWSKFQFLPMEIELFNFRFFLFSIILKFRFFFEIQVFGFYRETFS